jgi:hypothetical protein
MERSQQYRGRLIAIARALGALATAAITACGGAEDAGGPTAPAFSQGKPPLHQPPANVVGGFSIDLPAEEIAPGEERSPCYIFPLEVEGPSRFVGGGVLHTAPGMHHGNITTRKTTGEGFRPCPDDGGSGIGGEAADILDGGTVLFASSTQISGDEWQSFPDGIGFRIKDGYEIVARMHYLNATGAPITVAPRYEWFTIDEATLAQEIGPFAWTYRGFEIPPRSELTVGAACRLPEPMHLVNVLPHMHALGKAFTAEFVGGPLDGQPFLESAGYDPDRGVLLQYDPAIDLGQGDGARFSCTWANPTDKTIVEGIGDNEMCILFGYAWPPEHAFSTSATGEESCLALYPPVEP